MSWRRGNRCLPPEGTALPCFRTRRCMCAADRPVRSVFRHFSLPQRGRLIFGADLNCSESKRRRPSKRLQPEQASGSTGMLRRAAEPTPFATVETDLSLGPAPAVADAASATIMRRAGELLRVLAKHLFDGSDPGR